MVLGGVCYPDRYRPSGYQGHRFGQYWGRRIFSHPRQPLDYGSDPAVDKPVQRPVTGGGSQFHQPTSTFRPQPLQPVQPVQPTVQSQQAHATARHQLRNATPGTHWSVLGSVKAVVGAAKNVATAAVTATSFLRPLNRVDSHQPAQQNTTTGIKRSRDEGTDLFDSASKRPRRMSPKFQYNVNANAGAKRARGEDDQAIAAAPKRPRYMEEIMQRNAAAGFIPRPDLLRDYMPAGVYAPRVEAMPARHAGMSDAFICLALY